MSVCVRCVYMNISFISMLCATWAKFDIASLLSTHVNTHIRSNQPFTNTCPCPNFSNVRVFAYVCVCLYGEQQKERKKHTARHYSIATSDCSTHSTEYIIPHIYRMDKPNEMLNPNIQFHCGCLSHHAVGECSSKFLFLFAWLLFSLLISKDIYTQNVNLCGFIALVWSSC